MAGSKKAQAAATAVPAPFETAALRVGLKTFLDRPAMIDVRTKKPVSLAHLNGRLKIVEKAPSGEIIANKRKARSGSYRCETDTGSIIILPLADIETFYILDQEDKNCEDALIKFASVQALARTRAKVPQPVQIGSVKCGVYVFYDYDDQPIYVGQTRESLRSRIGRHLTNQRTDAVAMSVLDPFEVRSIGIYPLLFGTEGSNPAAEIPALNALERAIFDRLAYNRTASSEGELRRAFVLLNEKDPPNVAPTPANEIPLEHRGEIIPKDVVDLRGHRDSRIARRAITIGRLAQVISERELKSTGLRRALIVQSQRMLALSRERFEDAGGDTGILHRDASEGEDTGDV